MMNTPFADFIYWVIVAIQYSKYWQLYKTPYDIYPSLKFITFSVLVVCEFLESSENN